MVVLSVLMLLKVYWTVSSYFQHILIFFFFFLLFKHNVLPSYTASSTSAIGNLINLYAVLMQSKPIIHVAHKSTTLTHSSKLKKITGKFAF
jgi:hypothetical protein